MELNNSQHTAIELLRINIITNKIKTVNEVLDMIENILTEDKI